MDYTPYDLLNTKLHVDDSDFALDGGLFNDNYKSRDWKKNGGTSHLDFVEFGKRIGIRENRIMHLLDPFMEKQKGVEDLTEQSYLAEPQKTGYLNYYNRKRNLLI